LRHSAAVMRRKVAPRAIIAAMLTGFGLTALLYSLPNTPGDIAERSLPFIAASILAIVGSARKQ
jgi:hypothetical protein